jgi:DNA-binding winged helix-turn-helix (wHTH) protein
MNTSKTNVRRFGSFELDLDAEKLLKNGRSVRIQPQPFRLLCLLTSKPGTLITREEIQAALWKNETFVDFEQGVNFAVKQVREALGDRGEDSLYVQTVPKRGYRFLAPVTGDEPEAAASPIAMEAWDRAPQLHRALWENITDLRLAEEKRRRQQKILVAALALAVMVIVALLLVRL